MLFCAIGSTALVFAWAGITSPVGTIVFCVLYGFFSGTYISLTLTVTAVTLCPDIGISGLRIGMITIPCAAGLLIGSPVGGAIARDRWLGLQLFAGATLAVSTAGIAILRGLKGGRKVCVKC